MSASIPAAPTRPRDEELAQWCFNTTAVRDFLRLSRTAVDDSISAHLNALLTPSSNNPFSSSAAPFQTSAPRGDRRNVPDEACRAFKQTILFPRWATRDYVLTACQRVASGSDSTSSPPSSEIPSLKQSNSPTAVSSARTSRNYWGIEQAVDERLDPYSGRNYDWTRQPQAQQLRDVLQNELMVEGIVRSRTWAVLGERCAGGAANGGTEQWHNEYREWRRTSNAAF